MCVALPTPWQGYRDTARMLVEAGLVLALVRGGSSRMAFASQTTHTAYTRARAHSHCHHLLLDYALWYGSLLTMAVVLAQQGDTMKCGGGVFTPAACQGQLLRQRLESTGSSFQWLDE